MTWHVLSSSEDCEVLQNKFGGFHDGCMREIHLWTDHYVDDDLRMAVNAGRDMQARALFQRQWKDPSAIEMHFQEIEVLWLEATPENYDSIIFAAGLTHFEDSFRFNVEGVIQIVSRKLSWRDASHWMGSELRYRPAESNL